MFVVCQINCIGGITRTRHAHGQNQVLDLIATICDRIKKNGLIAGLAKIDFFPEMAYCRTQNVSATQT